MESRIKNPSRASQLIDFDGLCVEPGRIYPTDIDGLIEYKDSEYILFEVKRKGRLLPTGQRIALQRMIDDFSKIGKQAVALICEHTVDDPEKPIELYRCRVRQMYYSRDHYWVTPANYITAKEAVDLFHGWSKMYVKPYQTDRERTYIDDNETEWKTGD